VRGGGRWGGWLGWGLGVGLAFLQRVAYGRYCLTDAGAGEVRSWYDDTVPRIYIFFQERYWFVFQSSSSHFLARD